MYPDGSYQWFFDAQRSSWGRRLTGFWFQKLSVTSLDAINTLLDVASAFQFVVAIDEASNAVRQCRDDFKSLSHKPSPAGSDVAGFHDLATDDSRGALGVLLYGLGALPNTVAVCLGTSVRLSTWCVIGSPHLKQEPGVVCVNSFVPFRPADAAKLLRALINTDTLSESESRAVLSRLTGKGRYITAFVTSLRNKQCQRPARSGLSLSGSDLVEVARGIFTEVGRDTYRRLQSTRVESKNLKCRSLSRVLLVC
jgi:hypothetical protein